MFTWLNRKKAKVKIEVEKPNVTRVVYRDELTKKKAAVKKTVRFADSSPTILGEEKKEDFFKASSEEEGGGIRVKVKMTKQEAARLLSKCKEGGLIEFKDVARELVFIPADRVNFESSCTNN
ncbi:hypothetical protein L6164_019350 [Bauhinia variegata]|uniref:Uncharacterized protein n=1 Tax=Bauhinia variegata TaxID=167791 RepID=A0ACB9MS97_BAUVA|nr:hypothetical protein L6164_019350 [Bauhinia variegata]